MSLADLTELELVLGILGLINLTITLIVAFKIISKYIEFKKIEYLTIGLMMVFITSSWWASHISFLTFILFDFELPLVLHILISVCTLPLVNLFWIYSFCHLVYPKYKVKLLSIFVIIAVLFEIFIIIFLLTNPTLILLKQRRFIYTSGEIVILYTLFLFISSIITMSLFFKVSFNSGDLKIRWRGKFIFFSFICMIIGVIFGANAQLNVVFSILQTFFLSISSITGYIGWIMPDRVAKWLIKEE